MCHVVVGLIHTMFALLSSPPTKKVRNYKPRAAFQRSAFRLSTAGNDVVATIIIILFLFSYLFTLCL